LYKKLITFFISNFAEII